jgi:hypothetical protein
LYVQNYLRAVRMCLVVTSRDCHNYQASDLVVVDQPGCVTQANFAQWSEI